MESTNNYEDITRTIIGQTDKTIDQINLNMILQIIDKIESFTGCKLYNKDQLTNQIVELSEDNFLIEAKKIILKNLIAQIDFDSLFKSNLEFTLIFKEDDIIILYKNQQVNSDSFSQIKTDLLKNNLIDFPKIAELYVDNILDVVYKFINKDISVQYHCVNIPVPYLKLFEIKCKKSNSTTADIQSKCKELEKIKTGEYFKSKVIPSVQVLNQKQEDDELKAILMQIEEYENNKNSLDPTNLSDKEKKSLEDIYRMEVMSYLNDDEIISFLETNEKIDVYSKENNYSNKLYFTNYCNELLSIINLNKNIIAQFYYVYKLYCLINNSKFIIEENNLLRDIISNKINEISESLYILQSAELKLYTGVLCTINKSKEIIDLIEKKKNPNYVSKWQNYNNYNIKSDISDSNEKIEINIIDSDDEIDSDNEINYIHPNSGDDCSDFNSE